MRTEKVFVTTRDGRRMKLLILRPDGRGEGEGPSTGVLWMHGGGYETGTAGMVKYLGRARSLVLKYGAVVLSPEYRLSGQAPYPAALEDCYDALLYMKNHADALGIRSNQLMVGGESAGGGLAAALCMCARDREEVRIAYQMPLYPMLDNEATDSSRDNHAPVWNTRRNNRAWKKYLGGLHSGEVPPYAAAARQKDYAGLPPAYTFVGDAEPFYCETLAYIENLKRAGVAANVDVYPGCFHAFDLLLPFLKVSRRAIRRFEAQYCHAAAHCFAEQPRDAELQKAKPGAAPAAPEA